MREDEPVPPSRRGPPPRERLEDRGELVAAGKAAFEFLLEEDARLEVDDRPYATVLAYLLPALTFELEYDWRERAVFLLVARTTDGGRPPGYYAHEAREVRVHLNEALRRLGAGPAMPRAGAGKPRRRSRSAGMDEQVRRLGATLAESLPLLLDHAEKLFGDGSPRAT